MGAGVVKALLLLLLLLLCQEQVLQLVVGLCVLRKLCVLCTQAAQGPGGGVVQLGWQADGLSIEDGVPHGQLLLLLLLLLLLQRRLQLLLLLHVLCVLCVLLCLRHAGA